MNVKSMIIGFLALLYAGTAAAQTPSPQYPFLNIPVDSASVYGNGSFSWRNATGNFLSAKYQCIYRPFMFPGMPEGNMTSIYLCAGSRNWGTDTSCIYDSFKVSMGYTEDSGYATNHGLVAVPFLTGLTVVFQKPSFTIRNPKEGQWIKLSIINGGFSYNLHTNFVVEVQGAPRGLHNGINIMTDGAGGTIERTLLDTAQAVTSKTTFGGVLLIGFDINPTGVSELSNIRGLGLFPNPAPGGRFHLSLDAKQPMKEVSVRISDVTGREVLSRQFSNPGKSFFEEMNLSGAAPGMYFVRITADGEVFSRRVVLE